MFRHAASVAPQSRVYPSNSEVRKLLSRPTETHKRVASWLGRNAAFLRSKADWPKPFTEVDVRLASLNGSFWKPVETA